MKNKTGGKSKNEVPKGLNQKFKTKTGQLIELTKVIGNGDVWETKGKIKRAIVSHDGVKKIADKAGVEKNVSYTVLTQPDVYNNYQYTILAEVCRGKECVTEIGESNRTNLGARGKQNPANMAQKRAYDRAVFRLLGITNLLSEEELSDESEYNKLDDMENLNHKERKAIAPVINQILLAKTKADMAKFSSKMKTKAKNYSEEQLSYIRKLYQKRMGELGKISF